jgi:hypothetical protein
MTATQVELAAAEVRSSAQVDTERLALDGPLEWPPRKPSYDRTFGTLGLGTISHRSADPYLLLATRARGGEPQDHRGTTRNRVRLTDPTIVRPATRRDSIVAERTFYRRAVEAAVWGLPLVGFDALRQALLRDAGAEYGDIVYWSRPGDWRLQLPTPSASTLYFQLNFNVRAGPVVIEVPSALGTGFTGTIEDAWQTPIARVGAGGDDDGRGARYLVLPPGWEDAAPDGYFPVRSSTFNGQLRVQVVASAATAVGSPALEVMRQLRAYSLSGPARPRTPRFVDMSGKLFDGVVTFDEDFYDSLALMVNEEPVQRRDVLAMALLRSIGIEKGKSFGPEPGASALFAKAIAEVHAGLVESALSCDGYWPASHWTRPASVVGGRTAHGDEEERLDVDARACNAYLGATTVTRDFDARRFDVRTTCDSSGEPLHELRSYRLRVPAGVPARRLWSVAVYDLDTASFIRHAPRVSIDSNDRLLPANADGTVDVYFGRRPPNGREANWISTAGCRQWYAVFTLVGPRQPVFDRSWRLGDIEAVR